MKVLECQKGKKLKFINMYPHYYKLISTMYFSFRCICFCYVVSFYHFLILLLTYFSCYRYMVVISILLFNITVMYLISNCYVYFYCVLSFHHFVIIYYYFLLQRTFSSHAITALYCHVVRCPILAFGSYS